MEGCGEKDLTEREIGRVMCGVRSEDEEESVEWR